MDLSSLDTSKTSDVGSFLHLEAPDGRKLFTDDDPKQPIGITVLGADSKTIVAERHKQENLNTEKMRIRSGGRVKVSTAEEREESQMVILAKACVKFHHVKVDGKPVPDTYAGATALLKRFPWVRDQVQAWMDDRSNFLGESETSS